MSPPPRAILEAARKSIFGCGCMRISCPVPGAAELAAEMGAVTADHLEQIDASGIEALAKAGVQPVLLPASVYTLGSKRFAPGREMIECGLAVVLATDFNPGIFADAFHAVRALARFDADEDNAG